MWFKDKFFRYALGIILILVIIFLFGQMNYVFEPIKKFFAILFIPFLLAGLLYYLLRPMVRLLQKFHLNKSLSIALVYLIVIGFFALLATYAGSIISKQLNQLTQELPDIIQSGINKGAQLIEENNLGLMISEKIQGQLTSALQDIAPKITDSILNMFSTLTGIITIMIMVPFILFYLLRDDKSFVARFLKLIPKKMRGETVTILRETDKTLSIYIIGQAIIAGVLGILMYVGYLIIGMPYALILALFATLTSFIPMFGSAIGIIPAILVSLATEPFMAIKVLVIAVIVNQLEGNLISPNLVGKRLSIHPLTLIILFLVAANFFGFVGMLIGVPTYAVTRVVIKNALRIYRLKHPKLAEKHE